VERVIRFLVGLILLGGALAWMGPTTGGWVVGAIGMMASLSKKGCAVQHSNVPTKSRRNRRPGIGLLPCVELHSNRIAKNQRVRAELLKYSSFRRYHGNL
jgi:hypothetical protein